MWSPKCDSRWFKDSLSIIFVRISCALKIVPKAESANSRHFYHSIQEKWAKQTSSAYQETWSLKAFEQCSSEWSCTNKDWISRHVIQLEVAEKVCAQTKVVSASPSFARMGLAPTGVWEQAFDSYETIKTTRKLSCTLYSIDISDPFLTKILAECAHHDE